MRTPPTINRIAETLEATWRHAPPGRQAAETNAVLRELRAGNVGGITPTLSPRRRWSAEATSNKVIILTLRDRD